MTKQFKDVEVLDNVIYVDDTIIGEKQLLELLNENNQLRQVINECVDSDLETSINTVLKLAKENNQLKKQCAEQQLRITKLQHENAGLIEYLGKLENETFKGVK